MAAKRMIAALALLALAALGDVRPAAAESQIDPFLGSWSGRGNRTDIGAGSGATEVRDLMLTIARKPDDKVEISALAATGGGDTLGAPAIRMSTFLFKHATGGSWNAQKSCADPAETACAWAHVEGNTLVTTVVGRLESGAVEVQVARRSLVPGGLAVEYTRIVDGKTVRTVEGRLVRVAP